VINCSIHNLTDNVCIRLKNEVKCRGEREREGGSQGKTTIKRIRTPHMHILSTVYISTIRVLCGVENWRQTTADNTPHITQSVCGREGEREGVRGKDTKRTTSRYLGVLYLFLSCKISLLRA
jgi:hypothetical protein